MPVICPQYARNGARCERVEERTTLNPLDFGRVHADTLDLKVRTKPWRHAGGGLGLQISARHPDRYAVGGLRQFHAVVHRNLRIGCHDGRRRELHLPTLTCEKSWLVTKC